MSLFAPLESLISPPPQAQRVAFLSAQPFAHRGLHGRGVIENSRAAFSAAIAAGHGIELDVQVSRDGTPFVFHDKSFDRLTETTGLIGERASAQVSQIKLRGGSETIPPLADILDLVAGRVPILIEIKNGILPMSAICLSVRRQLEGYRDNVAVMSFNPEAGKWFHDRSPRTVRGLVVTEENMGRVKGPLARAASLIRAKPDFLAYDIRDLPTSSFASAQRKRGLPVLTWTVRTAGHERAATQYADQVIYEIVDTPTP